MENKAGKDNHNPTEEKKEETAEPVIGPAGDAKSSDNDPSSQDDSGSGKVNTTQWLGPKDFATPAGVSVLVWLVTNAILGFIELYWGELENTRRAQVSFPIALLASIIMTYVAIIKLNISKLKQKLNKYDESGETWAKWVLLVLNIVIVFTSANGIHSTYSGQFFIKNEQTSSVSFNILDPKPWIPPRTMLQEIRDIEVSYSLRIDSINAAYKDQIDSISKVDIESSLLLTVDSLQAALEECFSKSKEMESSKDSLQDDNNRLRNIINDAEIGNVDLRDTQESKYLYYGFITKDTVSKFHRNRVYSNVRLFINDVEVTRSNQNGFFQFESSISPEEYVKIQIFQEVGKIGVEDKNTIELIFSDFKKLNVGSENIFNPYSFGLRRNLCEKYLKPLDSLLRTSSAAYEIYKVDRDYKSAYQVFQANLNTQRFLNKNESFMPSEMREDIEELIVHINTWIDGYGDKRKELPKAKGDDQFYVQYDGEKFPENVTELIRNYDDSCFSSVSGSESSMKRNN